MRLGQTRWLVGTLLEIDGTKEDMRERLAVVWVFSSEWDDLAFYYTVPREQVVGVC